MPVEQPEEQPLGGFESMGELADEIWRVGNAFLDKIAEILAAAGESDAGPESGMFYQQAHCGNATVNITTGSSLNVRYGPGANFTVIGSLLHGTPVNIVGVNSGWFLIDGSCSGYSGWIADYLVIVDVGVVIPEIEFDPTPRRPVDAELVYAGSDWYQWLMNHQGTDFLFNPPDNIQSLEGYGDIRIYQDSEGYLWFEIPEYDPLDQAYSSDDYLRSRYAVMMAYAIYFAHNWGKVPVSDSGRQIYDLYESGTLNVIEEDACQNYSSLADCRAALAGQGDLIRRSARDAFNHPLNVYPQQIDNPCATEVLSVYRQYIDDLGQLGQTVNRIDEQCQLGEPGAFTLDFSPVLQVPLDNYQGNIPNQAAWESVVPGSIVTLTDGGGYQSHTMIVVGWGDPGVDWRNTDVTLYATYTDAVQQVPYPVPYVVDRGWFDAGDPFRGPRPFFDLGGYYQPATDARFFTPIY